MEVEIIMARPRKIPLEQALGKLDKSNQEPKKVKGGSMVVEWLSQVGFPKRHAVPKGESVSLCGRGGDRSWQKEPSDLPKCKKCIFLIKYKGAKEKD
ncbi:MAG: hypothetical protein DRG87_01070 [Deltaproteobacteria bacterium]|nr:MAG: hypothetical protein DRG87_01070 [Deltaproteobacteria bacterium]